MEFKLSELQQDIANLAKDFAEKKTSSFAGKITFFLKMKKSVQAA